MQEPSSCGFEAFDLRGGETLVPSEIELNHDKFRVIPPGTMVTLDYRPDRINVEVDAQNVILRVYCG